MASARLARLAAALWVAWAVVVWNVVFDQSLVLAGRRYVVAAVGAAQGPGSYARMDDWMQPALDRGFVAATAVAILLLAIGFICLRLATRPQTS